MGLQKKLIKYTVIRTLLKYYKGRRIVPSKSEEDLLWARICAQAEREHQQSVVRHRRILWTGVASAAAVLTGVVLWVNVSFLHENQLLSFDADENQQEALETPDKIKLISSSNEIFELDDETILSYNLTGNRNVSSSNRSSVTQLPETKPDTKPEAKKSYDKIIVPKGKRAHLILSDGSHLHVNASSVVTYPTQFDAKKREIFVEGEAYVDVFPNKQAPFIVNTANFKIQVLGTAFNVNTYEQNNGEVTLLRGKVNLSDTHGQSVILLPDEQVNVKEGTIAGKRKVHAKDYIAWTTGILKLENLSMQQAMHRIESFYGVRIELLEGVDALKLRGAIDLDCTIDQVLDKISFTAPVTFTKVDEHTYQGKAN